eukprot:CAMPEP_0119047116 /NCGR_PEP_ID=MMETSP1177-20130426/51062_1 /TAXON_ID=2985 /ORGANISM="Ochromonas sp, Strain CCMP1899" /LENGTH=328 /DNA_ID=CAMNT_0007021235 /DNA_START=930 /DNA_END=1916 /DNA_ORIENTATION=-
MMDSIISGTKSSEHAAVDLWGCSLETSCRNVDSSIVDDSDIKVDEVIRSDNDGIINTNDDSIDPSALDSAVSSSSDGNYRRESETSSIANSKMDIEHRYSIIDIAGEGNAATPNYISKENKRAIQDTLNVKLLNCKISGNKGIGLRMRQGRDCGGSLITGFITDCQIRDNEAGDVLRINEDYSIENTIENLGDTDSTISVAIKKSNGGSHTDKIRKSIPTAVWEFERDDSSSSKGGDWMAYDALSSKFLQRKYEVFLRSINKNPRKVDPTIELDSSSSSSDDGKSKKKYCSKRILLPFPLSRYEVDFSLMQQTNGDTHYMRAVRRREE